jgi:hypothetical protein
MRSTGSSRTRTCCGSWPKTRLSTVVLKDYANEPGDRCIRRRGSRWTGKTASPLARERLTAPGPWLRDKVGDALDGFFKDPYLLWFVAEDAPVHGRLPKNIGDVTRAILRAGRAASAV